MSLIHTECIDLVKMLIENGANINVKNSEGKTPIDLAAERGM